MWIPAPIVSKAIYRSRNSYLQNNGILALWEGQQSGILPSISPQRASIHLYRNRHSTLSVKQIVAKHH
jgi:hypothetical protein